jgi:hypothetical protein
VRRVHRRPPRRALLTSGRLIDDEHRVAYTSETTSRREAGRAYGHRYNRAATLIRDAPARHRNTELLTAAIRLGQHAAVGLFDGQNPAG